MSVAEFRERLESLRREWRLDEVEDTWATATPEQRADMQSGSVWASVAMLREDGPEYMRRAEWLMAAHPEAGKPVSHKLLAMELLGEGYDVILHEIAIQLKRWGDDPSVLVPAAYITFRNCDWLRAIGWSERTAANCPEVYLAPNRQMHIIALTMTSRNAEAAELLRESAELFPDADFHGWASKVIPPVRQD